MLLFKLIAVFFKGTVFFITVGLVVVIGGAMWSALIDAPMEDGGTFGDHVAKEVGTVGAAYASSFEGVNTKEVLKQDAKELEQLGRKTVKNIKRKTDPIVNDPELQKRLKEARELIEQYENQ
jgi:hypothetical protein